MPNTVDITFIRHAYSTANQYSKENGGKRPKSKEYMNAGLHEIGLDQIKKQHDYIVSKMSDYDIIITSPLRRAIETCLLLTDGFDKPKYVCPLVSEIGNLIENKGKPKNSIKDEIQHLPNYENLDFDPFFYEYGWKNIYDDGWETDNSKVHMITLSDDPWDVMSAEFLERIELLKRFLSSSLFTNKKILIVSHFNLIRKFTGKNLNNLDMIKVIFDQDNKTINKIK